MKTAILIIISLLMLSNAVWAQKPPDGFMGLKWGSTKEEAKRIFGDLEPNILRNDCLQLFNPKGKWEKLGEVKVNGYHLYFSMPKGKFYSGSVIFYSTDGGLPNFDILLKALTEKYGKPVRIPLVLKINPNAEVGVEYRWVLGGKVEIGLRHPDKDKVFAVLYYTYLPILNEMSKPRDEDIQRTKDKL